MAIHMYFLLILLPFLYRTSPLRTYAHHCNHVYPGVTIYHLGSNNEKKSDTELRIWLLPQFPLRLLYPWSWTLRAISILPWWVQWKSQLSPDCRCWTGWMEGRACATAGAGRFGGESGRSAGSSGEEPADKWCAEIKDSLFLGICWLIYKVVYTYDVVMLSVTCKYWSYMTLYNLKSVCYY